MVPAPQEFSANGQEAGAGGMDGERVVISGMSGLFPEARSVADLADILYNQKNPINSQNNRWTFNHPEVSQFTGKAPDLQTFDAQFFKVHYRVGHSMDPMSRKILEHCYQAIYDAGINPGYLSGKKVAVFIGTCFSETEKAIFYIAKTRAGFGIAGCSKSMFANRISYSLNVKGPSMTIDNACCSSIAAVEQAVQAITRGECEAAIVGGAHLNLHLQSFVHCNRVMTLSKDGTTKSFDENAAGCAKSEAINVVFLQKAKDALRIYAEIVHVKTEFISTSTDELGMRYGFHRDPLVVTDFLKRFYNEALIPTQAVEFVEALGTATPEADKQELEAISNVFCKDRTDPLLIGNVLSNIGYAEAATGTNSIIKVLLGYHTGALAGNLHCERPRRDVAALADGRMRVLRERTPFRRSYVAVNGLSVTGCNSHVLLHGRYKPKDLSRYKSNIPYLVTVSGRQESAVRKILNDLKTRAIDPEELALFHNIHRSTISGHLGRGYILLDKNEENKTVSLSEKADYFDDVQRPLWFVYSGMGSQWAGMGDQLMRIPIFAAAIERCRQVLEPKGIDIVHIITSRDKTIFDNILNSFVGIAAIQIGLTDILREIGLVPDRIIGHSVGELGCAYADGCFTAEEMILSAYSRGLVSVQTPFIRGSMAAVGIGYQQISSMCPPEIEVACHNGPDSCTISGPADVMRDFVTQLTTQNIFAKEVPCSNIAYHSRYIAEAGPGLLKYLSEVIKCPKPRSERWVSTSVPMEQWGEESAKYSSAEYHTNNLLRPVLFEESSRLVPANAVLVEVAPHGLLQAILKRSLPESCCHVPLTRRGHPDNARLLLEAIGQLYMAGYYPRIDVLYPKIEFPVSTGTPMLSHLIEWVHNEKWVLALRGSAASRKAAAVKFVISTHDEEHRYLDGNIIKGKNLYPFAAALVAVWDTLAMTRGVPRGQLSVQFRQVELNAQPVLHERRQLRLAVALHRGTGRFEVSDGHSIVAAGIITTEIDNPETQPTKFHAEDVLDQNTIYQMFSMRDFSYRGEFRSIHSANTTLSKALILWRENWVTLIDGMLQLNILRHGDKTVSLPYVIRKMDINLEHHNEDECMKIGNDLVKVVNISEDGRTTSCNGIVIDDILLRDLPTTCPDDNIINLKTLMYVPFFQFENTDVPTTMHVYLQVVAENINRNVVNILEITDSGNIAAGFKDIESIILDIPGIKSTYRRLELNKLLAAKDNFSDVVDILLVSGLARDNNLCQVLYHVLPLNTFIVNKEDTSEKVAANRPSTLYGVMCSQNIGSFSLELVRWRPTTASVPTATLSVRSSSDLDLLSATLASLLPQQKLQILAYYPPVPGLIDLIKHWRKEYKREIHLVMINHKISEDENLYQMLNNDMAFNILDHGKWGGEYYVPFPQNSTENDEVTLRCARVGDLDSLYWVQAPKSSESGIKIKVHYAGLNDLDMKRATGLIPLVCGSDKKGNDGFGMDFSGVTEAGDRVMGIVARGAVSSSLRVPPEQLWPVPAHWSLQDAATVPLAYCLAYYCLTVRFEMHPHTSVLVHGGAGALGQAVISIALAHHCRVFTTVSTVAKKHFLLQLFPNLKAENVGNSRDLSFGDMVLDATDGEGVDIVICCLKGDLKTVTNLFGRSTRIIMIELHLVSFKCGGRLSKIVDVSQIHDREKYDFGMFCMTKERHYCRVDLLSILNEGNADEIKRLQRLVGEGIARGCVRPLSRAVFGPRDAARAVRLLAAANQRGRALLRLPHAHDAHDAALDTPRALPCLQCTSYSYHVIVCDDDFVGLQLADTLVSRGVRKLIIRRLAPSIKLEFKIRQWQKDDVEVIEPAGDTANTIDLHSNVLSCLEGVFVVFTDCTKLYEFTSMLSNLDAVTRQASSPLKYFAVITTDDSFGRLICNVRKQNCLPVTLIKLPPIKKACDIASQSRDSVISVRQAVAVVEQAVCSAECSVLAHVSVAPKPTLISRVAAVADIAIRGDGELLKDTSTLSELGMNVVKSHAVHVLLRDMYNVAIPEEEIPRTTIETLRDIEKTLYCQEFENVTGLKAFFTYVDSDELLATSEMVVMPTLYTGSVLCEDKFDTDETYLCIVPGMEGHHLRFSALCERLKLPALVLQPGLHRPHEGVRDTAERYAKVLLEKAGLKKKFYLLGYESGVLVALELAAMLEDNGLTGTVFCLGAPPAEFREELRQHLRGLETEQALQDAVVRHMFTLMTGTTGDEGAGGAGGGQGELSGALRAAAAWPDKVEVAVRLLLGRVSHSAQYARQLMEAARGRLAVLLRPAGEARALRSRLVLLRPAPAAAAPAAAALQPHSLRPVAAHALRAPLAHAPRDLRCAAIINSYLDDDVLRAFNDKNLCESYVIAEHTYRTTVNE